MGSPIRNNRIVGSNLILVAFLIVAPHVAFSLKTIRRIADPEVADNFC